MNKKLLLIAALVILAVGVFFGSCGKGDLKAKLRAAQNAYAAADTLKTLNDRLQEQLAVVHQTEKELRTELEEVPELQRRVRDLRGREIALLRTVAGLDSIVAQGTGIDTVYITEEGTEVHRVQFSHEQPGINIEGYTLSPPGSYNIEARVWPIPMNIIAYELATGQVQVTVDTPEWVTLTQLNASFVKREPTWWQKNRKWIFFGGGVAITAIIMKH